MLNVEQSQPSAPGSQLSASADAPLTVIEPTKGWLSLNLREVWRYRELLQLLVWRNTVVRYKQSVAGIGWALLKPLISMVVLTLIFGRFLKIETDNSPRPIFYYSALLPWLYFAGCLTSASGSLVTGKNLVTKVYFPRLVLPISYLFTGLVDFCISFVVLVGMMVWYRDFIHVSWPVCLLPVLLLMAMITAFAFSLWLSALMVKYRDVQHLVPFLVQIWMYVSPVIFPMKKVKEALSPKWLFVYSLNPMVGVINGFRWALLGTTEPQWGPMAVGVGSTLLLLWSGLYFFRRTERTLVDIV